MRVIWFSETSLWYGDKCKIEISLLQIYTEVSFGAFSIFYIIFMNRVTSQKICQQIREQLEISNSCQNAAKLSITTQIYQILLDSTNSSEASNFDKSSHLKHFVFSIRIYDLESSDRISEQSDERQWRLLNSSVCRTNKIELRSGLRDNSLTSKAISAIWNWFCYDLN